MLRPCQITNYYHRLTFSVKNNTDKVASFIKSRGGGEEELQQGQPAGEGGGGTLRERAAETVQPEGEAGHHGAAQHQGRQNGDPEANQDHL